LKIDLQTLRLFANSMATCLASGLTPRKSLELSGTGTRSKALREVIRAALDRCDQGMAISDALQPGARIFPYYLLPVIRAGEAGGRLVEAFQLLERHCHRTEPSVKLVRNTWLYPLIIIVFGWILRTSVFVYFGKYQAAWQFLYAAVSTGLLVTLFWWLLFKFQPLKWVVDRVLLQIPLLRETEIRQAVVLFFATFRLSYEAGGLGVTVMFDLALQTVRNGAIRQDLLKARQIMDQNGTFGDAFGTPTLLDDDIKALVNTGSISGKLDQCLAKIVEKATHQIEVQLNLLNQFLQRAVSLTVAMSIVETILVCILW
jgi:type II secretory pathway component PulF